MTRLAFLLLTTMTLFAKVDLADDIVVQLTTEKKLLPVFLEDFMAEDAALKSPYLKQLEEVLSFDLNHNGMTYVVTKNPSREKRVKESKNLPQICKELNVFYLVKVQVKDKKLSARLFCVNSNTVKGVEGLPLTGNLSEDRRQIHQFADLIHKELFGKSGIASTRMLYTLRTKDWDVKTQSIQYKSDVWESDYDGKNARQVTKGGGYCVSPSYIPPEKGHATRSFFYVSYATGQPKIYVASLHDGVNQRFSFLSGNQLMPVSAHQRNNVAFISDVAGNPDLYLQPFNPEKGAMGKPQQLFAHFTATQGSPTFSPDGNQVAFVSNKDGSPRIYSLDLKNPKKGRPLLLTKHNHENTAPCWSPDGSKIAYCAKVDGVRQIWVYDVLTKEEKQLTRGPGNKENPSFAANSLHIVFNSTDEGACELYLINLNQPHATKISSGSGEKHYPCFEPRFG